MVALLFARRLLGGVAIGSLGFVAIVAALFGVAVLSLISVFVVCLPLAWFAMLIVGVLHAIWPVVPAFGFLLVWLVVSALVAIF